MSKGKNGVYTENFTLPYQNKGLKGILIVGGGKK
jgi:hypothetical protein